MSASPIDQFRDAIRAALGHAPAQIIGDGKIHRFSTGKNKRDEAGWYLFHDDDFPAGEFGDWRTGDQQTWHANGARKLSQSDRDRIREVEAAREKKRAAAHASAAREAQALWDKASPASAYHPYLVEKGIEPHGVRENSEGQLLVPVRIDGGITSLEAIADDGKKLFYVGGRISGGSYLIGEPGDKIAVAEGFATAATIHEMSGLAVVVAFCAGNLLAVARVIRAKYPTAKIILAADDDFGTERERGFNPGIRDARAAAKVIWADVAVPPFNRDAGETGTDWNDFAAARGHADAKAAFRAVEGCGDKASNGEGEPFETAEMRAGDDAQPAPRVIEFTPYVWRDPKTIPLRKWLYGKHYIRKFLSETLAPGGLGKSSLVLVEAVAMAAGISLLGVPVPKQLRVVYWNGEDPAEEIERRIAAILLHFRIDHEKIKGWLFVDSGRVLPIRIAEVGKAGLIFTTDAETLTKALIKLKADVFIADPFVKTHGVPENDNGAIDQIAARYAAIADEADCAVELTHHVRKAGSMGRADVTVDDGRGAGALKDAARDVRTLNVMAPEEATGAQVKPKDRKSYFRVDTGLGKQNMAPPSDSADWYRIISVPLRNDPEFPCTDGDSVGVVTRWELPGVFAGVPGNALTLVQDAIEAGGPWGKNAQAEDWAGYAIADTLDLDASDTVQKERVKQMVDAWIGTGALKVSRGPSPKNKSRKRPTVIVGSRTVEGET